MNSRSALARTVLVSAAFGGALALSGCSTPKGESASERRAYVQTMADKALADLYAERPDLRDRVNSAAGYGAFSTIGTNLIFVSTGGGFGLVHDNSTGEDTYMRMGEAGVGIGIGVKDFRAIFVFSTQRALDGFVEDGWTFGGDADAAAKTGDQGGAAGARGAIGDEITVYQLTENGLALSATVSGTRYWKDEELN